MSVDLAPSPLSEKRTDARRATEAPRPVVWPHAANAVLGLWLATAPATFHPHPAALFSSDVASGVLIIVLSGLALWWLPYLAGVTVPWATAGTGETWAQLHARTYAKTIIVLPRIGNRPRPNLEHMILHALMLAAAIVTLGYAGSL